MSGPRFYDGQPVVCVDDEWCYLGGDCAGLETPRRGQKYVVAESLENELRRPGQWGVVLVEIPKMVWDQDGFAPITEDRVEEIKREALRPPLELVQDWADQLAEDGALEVAR